MELKDVPLTGPEISGIQAIEKEKYLTNDWVYQKSLLSSESASISKKTSAGIVKINMSVANNMIKDIIITGDFFSTTEFISTLEKKLRWNLLDRKVITKIIKNEWNSCPDSIFELGPEILVDCILECGNLPGKMMLK